MEDIVRNEHFVCLVSFLLIYGLFIDCVQFSDPESSNLVVTTGPEGLKFWDVRCVYLLISIHFREESVLSCLYSITWYSFVGYSYSLSGNHESCMYHMLLNEFCCGHGGIFFVLISNFPSCSHWHLSLIFSFLLLS